MASMQPTCPECGAPVAERAAVCPRCGFPLRRDAAPVHAPVLPAPAYGTPGHGTHAPVPPRAPGPRVSTGAIVAAIIGVGVLLVVLIGVALGVLAPRVGRKMAHSNEAEGTRLLREAWAKEQEYRRRTGAYAGTLHDLGEVGYQEPPLTAAYGVMVITTDPLCLEGEPNGAIGPTLSVGERGTVAPRGCGRQVDEPDAASPEAVHEEGRILLQQGFAVMQEYRKAHGGALPEPQAVEDGVARRNALAYWTLAVDAHRGGGACLIALPHPRVDAQPMSVDAAGGLHRGSVCAGPAVEHFADELR